MAKAGAATGFGAKQAADGCQLVLPLKPGPEKRVKRRSAAVVAEFTSL